MQAAFLQHRGAVGQCGGGSEDAGQEPAPRSALSQGMIHEDPQDKGHGEAEQSQQQAAGECERHAAPGAPEPGRDMPQDAGPVATLAKIRAGPESQRNTGVAAAELLRRDLAATRGRIVEEIALAVKALQDQEVVELPEKNQGEGHFPEQTDIHAAPRAF